jgi:acetyltransferase-like isoleucine patch superfamily enzyme
MLQRLLLAPFALLNRLILIINKVEVNVNRSINGLLIINNSGTFKIGSDFKANSSSLKNVIGGDTRCSFVINKGASIVIGDNVKISNSAFYSNASITIEDHVMIGGSCRFWDSDFHPIDPEVRLNTPNEHYKSKPILIKNNAFIGGGSIILKGVTVGANSVVGAGSVVSRSIPDNEIWAGNPAKFIKKLEG